MTGERIDCFYDTFDAAPRACTRAPSSIDTNYLSSQLLAPQISTQAPPASSNRLYHQATDDIDEMFITTPFAHATPTPIKQHNLSMLASTPSTVVSTARILNPN
jgi:hypothetical protein